MDFVFFLPRYCNGPYEKKVLVSIGSSTFDLCLLFGSLFDERNGQSFVWRVSRGNEFFVVGPSEAGPALSTLDGESNFTL